MPDALELSSDDKALLLAIARESIQDPDGVRPDTDARIPLQGPVCEPSGVFVTLKEAGMLRGCIGRVVGDQPLWRAVQDVARESAYSDPRFEGVVPSEIEMISIEISILSRLEPVASVEDIVVGRDGLLVEGDGRRGLLLPQVATDRGWSKETFLSETCRKARLDPDRWKAEGLRISRFGAVVFSDSENPRPTTKES